MSKRMTISFSNTTEKELQEIIDNPKFSENTKSQIIRNSVILYKTILNEIDNGNCLTISDKNGKLIKEILIIK